MATHPTSRYLGRSGWHAADVSQTVWHRLSMLCLNGSCSVVCC